jgi:outer membrane autotransporter protein
VTWDHASIQGYREQGMMVREAIATRGIDAAAGEATVRLESPGGAQMSAYVEAGYRDYLSYTAGDVTVSLPGNTALPLSTAVGRPSGGVVVADAGVHGKITDHLSVGVDYYGQHGSGFRDDVGSIGVKWRF